PSSSPDPALQRRDVVRAGVNVEDAHHLVACESAPPAAVPWIEDVYDAGAEPGAEKQSVTLHGATLPLAPCAFNRSAGGGVVPPFRSVADGTTPAHGASPAAADGRAPSRRSKREASRHRGSAAPARR